MKKSVRKTVRDMARLPTDKIFVWFQSSRKMWTFTFLLLSVLWGVCFFGPQPACAQENDIVLKESGIHYPDGFDANTVGIVQGRAYGFLQPEKGPVQFRLDSGRENYIVIATPPWYWKDLGVMVSDGSEVKVRGSKSLGKDGNLYIIGQELEVVSTGKVFVLRDDEGYPLWKGGQGLQKGGGGFGSPQKRIGGGMGRGRR